MKMDPSRICLIVAAGILAATACSAQPAEAEVRKTLDGLISSESNGMIAISRFTMREHQEGIESGQQFSVVSYRVELGFKVAGVWRAGGGSPQQTFRVAIPPDFTNAGGRIAQGAAEIRRRDQNPGERVTAGEKVTIDGRMTYARGSQGWALVKNAFEVAWGPDLWILPAATTAQSPTETTPPKTAARLSTAERQSIMNNLRQLTAAADQYYIHTGKTTVTLDELVGPTGYVKRIDLVVGENYRTIKFVQGLPLEVTTASGEKVSYAESAIFQASPTAVVQAFYAYANAGRYADAQELLSEEARNAIAGPLGQLSGGWKGICDRNTKNGTIQLVEILSEDVRGEGATVIANISFRDGSSKSQDKTSLVKVGGKWKIGL